MIIHILRVLRNLSRYSLRIEDPARGWTQREAKRAYALALLLAQRIAEAYDLHEPDDKRSSQE